MSAPGVSDHPAAAALARRHRVRWCEAIPWILLLGFYFVFPRHLGFGTELLTTILFAISLDLALGYAGWGAGQLESEIQANGWLNCPADSELIFSGAVDGRYEAALRKIGIDPGMLSTEAGHA